MTPPEKSLRLLQTELLRIQNSACRFQPGTQLDKCCSTYIRLNSLSAHNFFWSQLLWVKNKTLKLGFDKKIKTNKFIYRTNLLCKINGLHLMFLIQFIHDLLHFCSECLCLIWIVNQIHWCNSKLFICFRSC